MKDNHKGNELFQKLEPFFEKVEKLTNFQRLGILLATLVLIGVGFYFGSYKGRSETIDRKEKEIAKLEKELAEAKKKAAQLTDLRKKMEETEAAFLLAAQALPDKSEIPSILTSISQSGKVSDLDFTLFKPEKEVLKGFYAEIPISIVVTGGYHNIGLFFDKLAQLSRIVNITNINLAPTGKEDDLIARCRVVTYRFLDVKDSAAK